MDNELAAIQRKLRELGHDPGPTDGVWGSMTRDAIAAHLGLTKRQMGAVAIESPWLAKARAQLGVKEKPGAANSGAVGGYFKAAVGVVHPDNVPWCAAFVGAMLAETGYKGTGSLMARSYLEWGKVLTKPLKGAVVIFKRGAAPAGHVGFVDDWTANTIKCVGGNQADAVTVASFSRAGVLGYRWPSEAVA